MLTNLPIGVRDIIQRYADGHPLKMNIKKDVNSSAPMPLYYISIKYGPIRVKYRDFYDMSKWIYNNGITTLKMYKRNYEITTFIIDAIKRICIIDDNVTIHLDCNQMIEEVETFIGRCKYMMIDGQW